MQVIEQTFSCLETPFGRILFYDWRYLPGEKPNPEFVLSFPRYKGGSVLLARANFGCGSSREHAPWQVEALFQRTEKEEGSSLTVNLPQPNYCR